MKKTLLTLALLGGLTLSFAEDPATIDKQITEIQNAPAQERVRLMNQFKLRVANMNNEDRQAAITQLQQRMRTNTAEGVNAEQEMQMQQSQEMLKIQNMNQHRIGNQFRQQNQSSSSPAGSVPKMMGGR
ncbi:hypothetical protein [Sulfurimonas sp. C5]|uniref:hypothetical protein n=1 Tax=Sulfurimonas sp. C5 TaxID=3036947 RepID=UPI0024572A80|nr:hypothetical protein [Sulfurimonas sp. C5]MDH4944439.1 hypothetical protein [Sulfurimonas sp. C5]